MTALNVFAKQTLKENKFKFAELPKDEFNFQS